MMLKRKLMGNHNYPEMAFFTNLSVASDAELWKHGGDDFSGMVMMF